MKRNALDKAAEQQLTQMDISFEGQWSKGADKEGTLRAYGAPEGEEADEDICRAVVRASLFA